MGVIGRMWGRLARSGGRLPEDLLILGFRVALGLAAWQTVQARIEGWELFGQSWRFYRLSPGVVELFRRDYPLPLLPADWAAHLAVGAQFFLSLMLLLGLGTRLAAFGLLAALAAMQFFLWPQDWLLNLLQAAGLLYLFKHGGGRVALDNLRVSVNRP